MYVIKVAFVQHLQKHFEHLLKYQFTSKNTSDYLPHFHTNQIAQKAIKIQIYHLEK